MLKNAIEAVSYLNKIAVTLPAPAAKTKIVNCAKYTNAEIVDTEIKLKIKLPDSFCGIIQTYDFSSLSISYVNFYPGYKPGEPYLAQLANINNTSNPFYHEFIKSSMLQIGMANETPMCIACIGSPLNEGGIYVYNYENNTFSAISHSFEELLIVMASIFQKKLENKDDDDKVILASTEIIKSLNLQDYEFWLLFTIR